MTDISAETVRKLREATNVSMMECKKALVEAGGDLEKATVILRKRGMSIAASKAARAANQGLVAAASAEGGRIHALVEVNCETDFVARNATFQEFVRKMAEKACGTDGSLGELCRDETAAKVAEIGENIVVRRNVRYVLSGAGAAASYVHLGGKVGVLVELGCDNETTAGNPAFRELLRDITLQVAASNPRYLSPADVPENVAASEREIYASQVKDKPPQVVGKIVEGKMKKFYSEVCLLDQPFIKEPKITVAALIQSKGRELGDRISVRRFVRYQVGA